MADDEHDAVVDDLIGGGHALLGIAGVVVDLQRDLVAVDPAFLVDGLGRFFHALSHLVTERGHRAGDCGHHRHLNIRPRGRGRAGEHQESGKGNG